MTVGYRESIYSIHVHMKFFPSPANDHNISPPQLSRRDTYQLATYSLRTKSHAHPRKHETYPFQ